MKKLLLFLLPILACAQTLTLTGPASIKSGTTLPLTLTLTNGTGPAGLQWIISASLPTGTISATSAGTAATVNKQATTAGGDTILVGDGATLNATPIADGLVSNISIPIPGSVVSQTLTLTLTAYAVSPNGSLIPVSVNPPMSVTVLPSTNFCDLNGDGQVTAADVALEKAMVLALPQSVNCARNNAGCNVGAIQIVINAALGGLCTATQ